MIKLTGRLIAMVSAVCFTIMYLVISYHNRLAFDDFAVIASALKYGRLGGIVNWYNNLDGCLGTVVFHQIFGLFLFNTQQVYLFNNFTIFLLIASVFFLSLQLARKYELELSATDLALGSTVFVSLFYLMAPHYTQCFYWFVSVLPYVYPMIFLCLAFSFFVQPGKINLLFACAFFALFSLTRIHFAFIVLLCMGAYQAWYLFTNRKLNIPGTIVTAIIFAGMVIVVAAPGNYKRQAVELSLNMSDPSFVHSIKVAAGRLTVKILHEKLRYLACAFPIALFLGAQLTAAKSRINYAIEQLINFGIIKTIIIGAVFILALFFINSAIMYKAVKNCYYFDRVWTHFFLAILLFDILIGAMLGYKFQKYLASFSAASGIAMLYLTYVFIKSAYTIMPINREYARAYDNNIALMLQAKKENRQTTLYLHPMPSNSGFIQEWHIQSDTAFWVNQCLAYDYAMPCPVSDSTIAAPHVQK